jgi:hypothetical protein
MTNLSTVPPELRMKALSANNIEHAARWCLISQEQALKAFGELMDSIDNEHSGAFVTILRADAGPVMLAWLAGAEVAR